MSLRSGRIDADWRRSVDGDCLLDVDPDASDCSCGRCRSIKQRSSDRAKRHICWYSDRVCWEAYRRRENHKISGFVYPDKVTPKPRLCPYCGSSRIFRQTYRMRGMRRGCHRTWICFDCTKLSYSLNPKRTYLAGWKTIDEDKTLKNLAGDPDCDAQICRELVEARIEAVPIERCGCEVDTGFEGRLKTPYGEFRFHRAWYYWIVNGQVPIKIARKIYQNPVGQKDVRADGHCCCLPPDKFAEGDPPIIAFYHIDSQWGLNLFVQMLA